MGSILARVQDINRAASASVIGLGERTLYAALRTYYAVMHIVRRSPTTAEEQAKGLRTPVSRMVEFYVTHIWPGPLPKALPIVFEKDQPPPNPEAVERAIQLVWKWSNWEAKKQYAIRLMVMTGDLILKVCTRREGVTERPDTPENRSLGDLDLDEASDPRVYLQVIDPGTVTDLEVDDRDNVIYIRIDIPKTRRTRDETDEAYTYTEVWDTGGVRIWEHDKGIDEPLRRLGVPQVEYDLEMAGTRNALPFIHAPFKDVGGTRGMPAYWQSLSKIDEADSMASKLHQLIFRWKQVLWAIENNAKDDMGVSLPPAQVSSGDTIELGGEQFISLTGQLRCLVPNVDLGDILEILNAQLEENRKDMPELLADELLSRSDQIATETARLLMEPAFQRIREARGNAEAALARADILALRMAQTIAIPGFLENEIGTIFDHSFEERDLWPQSEKEAAAIQEVQARTDVSRHELGIPLSMILEERGYTKEQITTIMLGQAEEKAAKKTASDAWVDRAMREFDQGQVLPNQVPAELDNEGATKDTDGDE